MAKNYAAIFAFCADTSARLDVLLYTLGSSLLLADSCEGSLHPCNGGTMQQENQDLQSRSSQTLRSLVLLSRM